MAERVSTFKLFAPVTWGDVQRIPFAEFFRHARWADPLFYIGAR